MRRELGDDELAWMLAWYHAQSPFLLELYGATPALMRFAQSLDADAWREENLSRQAMAMRGQMGRYWIALMDDATQ